MFKRRSRRRIWGMGVLYLIIPAISPSQEAAKSAKKPELIELQLKVSDKKDGSPIDDADVKVMWGQEHESGSGDGITNANGIARIKNVPRGKVVIRVIANGYKTVAPSVDLNRGEQPVKIEMEKEAKAKDKDQEPPPANRWSSLMLLRGVTLGLGAAYAAQVLYGAVSVLRFHPDPSIAGRVLQSDRREELE